MLRILLFALSCASIECFMSVGRSAARSFVTQPKTGEIVRTELRSSVQDEEEEEIMKEAEKFKQKFMRGGLVNDQGVKYAPWMSIDRMAVMKAREERSARKRKERKREQGNLWLDATGAEAGGVGLKNRMAGDNVELEWTTDRELVWCIFELLHVYNNLGVNPTELCRLCYNEGSSR